MRNAMFAGSGRTTAVIGAVCIVLGCGLSPGGATTEASDSQSQPNVENQRGTHEAAVGVIAREVTHMIIAAIAVEGLMPGMQDGIAEPGSYFAEDFEQAGDLPGETQVVLDYFQDRIRDSLWHAGYPMWGLDVWESPDSEQPVQVRRTPEDTLLVTVRTPNDEYLGVIFYFIRDTESSFPFMVYPRRYGVSSKFNWDLFAKTLASLADLKSIPNYYPMTCGDVARSQGYADGYCYTDVRDSGDPPGCKLAPDEQWVCEVSSSSWWHDQWRSLGPSSKLDGENVVPECQACLVYNDHIPNEAFWQWNGSADATGKHDVIKLRTGGVLNSTGRLRHSGAEAQLCLAKTPTPYSLSDIDCGPMLRGCIRNIAGNQVIQVQSDGWPELNCEDSADLYGTSGPFLDETVACTGSDCVRIELAEQGYDRLDGHVRFSNATATDVPQGVFERAAQRLGTKRWLLYEGFELSAVP